MNDPCAPGYDASTGLFHLMYQWNPYSHLWDHISWGAATSSDLVSWTYSSSEVSVSAPFEKFTKATANRSANHYSQIQRKRTRDIHRKYGTDCYRWWSWTLDILYMRDAFTDTLESTSYARSRGCIGHYLQRWGKNL